MTHIWEYFTGTGQRIQWHSAKCEELKKGIKVIISYWSVHKLEEENDDDTLTLDKVLDIVHHDLIIQ